MIKPSFRSRCCSARLSRAQIPTYSGSSVRDRKKGGGCKGAPALAGTREYEQSENLLSSQPKPQRFCHGRKGRPRERERNVLFNDALNTFCLRLYGVRHMVKDHSDSEKGNPLPPHSLLLSINSKGSFIYTMPQTG